MEKNPKHQIDQEFIEGWKRAEKSYYSSLKEQVRVLKKVLELDPSDSKIKDRLEKTEEKIKELEDGRIKETN